MLGKLLKYDLKSQFKSLLPIYLVALVLPIFIRIIAYLQTSISFLATFYGMLIFLWVIVIIGVFIWTLIVAVKQFYNNLLKDEGYLTNTLPVKKSHLILSKEITSLCTIIVSAIVVVVSVLMVVYHGDFKTILEDISFFFSFQYDVDLLNIIFWMLATMLVGWISQIQMFYVAMMLGQTRNTNKIAFSFVYGIILYVVIQMISFITLGIDYLINPDLMSVLDEVNPTLSEAFDSMIFMLASSMVSTLICMIGFHYITVYLAKKKLNLE